MDSFAKTADGAAIRPPLFTGRFRDELASSDHNSRVTMGPYREGVLMGRWSAFLLDEAELDEMPGVPLGEIAGHADAVLAGRPDARGLYRRWERQQWSAEEVELGPDGEEWAHRMPRVLRDRLTRVMHTFVVGEYTGLELLGPILASCPGEHDLLFLGTQVADESRHTAMMARIADEVLGKSGGLAAQLPTAWSDLPPAYRQISIVEAEIVKELSRNPGDHARWLRAVTVFHFVTEGLLALDGQRTLVQGLGRVSFLQGIKTGFTAMLRDEARHVGYGMHALRRGLADGYHDEMFDLLEEMLPLAVHIDFAATGGDREAPQRRDVPPRRNGGGAAGAEQTAERLRRLARRRLREIGFGSAAVDHLMDRCREVPASLTTAPPGGTTG
ncbi:MULTISPECIES: ribonucleotide-diphosphate reductase subunit beta [Actinomadura]|uniref:Ribonucleotide-diphosphate reductase subunit beta n=1 Tax=Actinomadura yumaensis TaxID=111807 RepID=A0ABW2CJ14_9ACTN|nr:ribonucleotide-diphosphate reductase subunit beta [Actinomadura sp. J1-007]